MKTLLLMRHAKSSWDQDELTDFERPLNHRGQKDAPRMGRFLKQQNLIPDLIISSTAVRAATTATIVARMSGYEKGIHLTPALYESSLQDFLGVLEQIPDEVNSVLLVSHNPMLEEVTEYFSGSYSELPTAAIVHCQGEINSWSEIVEKRNLLIKIYSPKSLEKNASLEVHE